MTSTKPAIACENLSIGYDGTPVLEDLSFEIDAGSTIGLVGKSGSGKSTLLKTFAGILPPITGSVRVLEVEYPGTPPAGEVGYIPQNLGLVPHESVISNVLHGTLPTMGPVRTILGRYPTDAIADARDAIERVGLSGTDNTRVKSLSGGQQRRVSIARALVQKPRVLLADEILSELDAGTAELVIEALEELQAVSNTTTVIVEHDRTVIDDLADRTFSVENDGIVTPSISPTGQSPGSIR